MSPIRSVCTRYAMSAKGKLPYLSEVCNKSSGKLREWSAQIFHQKNAMDPGALSLSEDRSRGSFEDENFSFGSLLKKIEEIKDGWDTHKAAYVKGYARGCEDARRVNYFNGFSDGRKLGRIDGLFCFAAYLGGKSLYRRFKGTQE